jgi:uncharacterized membrane protein YphA (DoxX/SURF4 family)
MKLKSDHGKILLRISLALLFLWFGVNQLYSPANWTGFVPEQISSIISAGTIVFLNGILEVILGLTLLVGIYTRLSALILALHLFPIALSMGYSAITIRDLGLALATLSIVFLGPDSLSLDSKFR